MSEQRFDRLEKMMEQLIQMVSHNNAVTGELRQEVGELRQEISDVKDKVIKLEQTVARIEHDHGNKISALFDGFTLRGDQIDRLQEHLDERLDAIQTDLSYIVGKIAVHDRSIVKLNKQVKPNKLNAK